VIVRIKDLEIFYSVSCQILCFALSNFYVNLSTDYPAPPSLSIIFPLSTVFKVTLFIFIALLIGKAESGPATGKAL
jgi:hypothetical protein